MPYKQHFFFQTKFSSNEHKLDEQIGENSTKIDNNEIQ